MITGKTKIVGIFGDPIEHTLSPLIHNTAFKELGLDYCYVPFHVKKEKIKEAVEAIRALNIRGVNITVPHKEEVMQYLDEISEEAKYIGAVNTVLNDRGILKGYNTDCKGFIMSLKEEKVFVKNKKILILGAGGAAKALVYGILKEGGNLYLFNRTLSKAYKIKDIFESLGKIEIIDEVNESLLNNIDIVVNATSLGLKKDDPMPLNPDFLTSKHIYCDIVYPKTPLMKEAEKKKCKVVGGTGMLIYQAFYAFKIFTGTRIFKKIFKKIKKTIDKY